MFSSLPGCPDTVADFRDLTVVCGDLLLRLRCKGQPNQPLRGSGRVLDDGLPPSSRPAASRGAGTCAATAARPRAGRRSTRRSDAQPVGEPSRDPALAAEHLADAARLHPERVGERLPAPVLWRACSTDRDARGGQGSRISRAGISSSQMRLRGADDRLRGARRFSTKAFRWSTASAYWTAWPVIGHLSPSPGNLVAADWQVACGKRFMLPRQVSGGSALPVRAARASTRSARSGTRCSCSGAITRPGSCRIAR